MKTIIKLICTPVLLLLISTVTAYGIGIETTITDITYDPATQRYDFLIKLRKGTDYIPNTCDGDFVGMDYRFDVYAESGVVFADPGTSNESSKLKQVRGSTNPAAGRLNITSVTMNKINLTQAPPEVKNSYIITFARNPYIGTSNESGDLDDVFVTVAGVSLYVESGTPTPATKIKVRTEDQYSSVNRRSHWANNCYVSEQPVEPYPTQNEFSIIECPGAAIWMGALSNDWNDAMNWTPNVVPPKCFDIFIPGNIGKYPDLSENVECQNIYFIQGAELGRPDLLTYEKVFIQYNFGLWQGQDEQITDEDDMDLVLNSASTYDRMKFSASASTALDRERWYMLSSPLKGVVTGDLSFGGFPLTFMMKFDPVKKDNQSYSVGNWTTAYTSMTEELACTEGFAFYMYGFGNKWNNNTGCEEAGDFNDPAFNDLTCLPFRNGEKYGIKETNGILELPFFADSTNLYAHRTQVYNSVTNKSTFYSINDGENIEENFNKLTGTNVSVNRENNNGNYRFATEEFKSNAWVFRKTIPHPVSGLNDGDEFLVGNPYMSSIDMIKFMKDNPESVERSFRIWNGDTFITCYVDILDNALFPTEPDDLRYIAPLQGFFLTYKGSEAVNFNVEKISTVRPAGSGFNLRSANETKEENILRIKAENDITASYALIVFKEGASNNFISGEDVQKLFSPYDYVPEIYSLAGETPVDINFINDKGEVIVPLGIKTERTGDIMLTFTGMDNYFKASKIELIDARENLTFDLTGKSSYTYNFNHTEKGIQNGRFSLRFENPMTALPDVSIPDDLKVYGDSKGIYVVTSSSDPVQQLVIYDFQGRKMYESTSNLGYYPLQGNFGNIPLIVEVKTRSQVKTVKIISG